MSERILIADDDALSRDFLCEVLRKAGHEVDEASTGREAREAFDPDRHGMVFTDLRMPDGNGLDVLSWVKSASPSTPVVLITAFGAVEVAVQAMRDGAEDFIVKPFGIEQIEMVLERAKARERCAAQGGDRPAAVRRAAAGAGTDAVIPVGSDPKWVACLDLVQRIAPTRATVLLRGESGTGKEILASLLHAWSDRETGPFVRTNCAALQPTLLSSELFGHEKGAFTGADETKAGRFELADGGTLFLDEIGEVSPEIQAKLLRVLETGEFERVGGRETLKVHVRVVCATNRNLERMIDEGTFREDLFYRLNVVPIELPPLRSRKGDIPALAKHFAERCSAEIGRTPPVLTREAMDVLTAHDWPGNVRELANVVQRAVLTSAGDALHASDIPVVKTRCASGAPDEFVGQSIADVERRLILATLQRTGNNKTEAAKILGVTARTLSNKIKLWKEGGLLPVRAGL